LANPNEQIREVAATPLLEWIGDIVMDHNLQVLLAVGISGALCLVAWVWARRQLSRLSHSATADRSGKKLLAIDRGVV
jgi:hypothetical protein